MEKTIQWHVIFTALSKKLALIMAFTILFGAVMFTYCTYFVTEKYSTSVSIIVHNAQTVNANTNLNDLSAADKLIGQFVEILQNNAILAQVSDAVGADPLTGEPRVTAKELSRMVSFSSKGNAILKITATSVDPELCLDICEAMATRGSELLRAKVEASSVQRIEATKEDIAEPQLLSKGTIRKTALGCIFGFLISAGPIALMSYLDDTIKSGEEITQRHGIPVLGEVPSVIAGNNGPESEVKENGR